MSHTERPLESHLKPLSPDPLEVYSEITESVIEQMIKQQRGKVHRIAKELIPSVVGDDLLNPHDFPELEFDPRFNFEDGILSGLVSAQMALRAHFRQLPRNPAASY